jgi:septal ring factor EnvC (AmiA/AmiB activator)
MSNGDLPEGFWTWFLGTIGVVVGTLATTVAALFKINESKNTTAIAAQEKEITALHAEVKSVRDAARVTEEARIECERDRARLAEKCGFIESRLARLEEKA